MPYPSSRINTNYHTNIDIKAARFNLDLDKGLKFYFEKALKNPGNHVLDKPWNLRIFQIFSIVLLLGIFIGIQGNAFAQTSTGPVENLNTGLYYQTIQAAINNATTGDTIQVSSGTYKENVIVSKSITLEGQNTGNGLPVIDGSGGTAALSITVDGVTLKGFQATNTSYGIYLNSNNNIVTGNIASGNSNAGIFLVNSNNNNLTGNTANNNNNGIVLEGSSYNRLTGNTANNNSNGNGITIEDSSNNNNLTGNTANNNNNNKYTINYNFGIYILQSSNNNVIGNTVDNNNYGIYLNGDKSNGSNYNNVSGNTVNNNQDGILLDHSFYNNVYGNTVEGNTLCGIYLLDSSANDTVIDNTVTGNDINVQTGSGGIYFQYTTYNTVVGNNVSNNGHGIYLDDSSNNNNLTGNTADNNKGNGIYIDGSSYNIVEGNQANSNINDGIQLFGSDYNTIDNNTANMNGFGIQLTDSIGNGFWLNEIAGNIYRNAAVMDGSSNSWDSPGLVQYVYNGQAYKNYTGNYWGDDQGTNQYHGIENAPYTIDTYNIDNYPMVGGMSSGTFSTTLNLKVGWNLVGWCVGSSDAATVSKLVPNLYVIAKYNTTSNGYDPYVVGESPLQDNFAMQTGVGYFIYSNVAQTLNFGDL